MLEVFGRVGSGRMFELTELEKFMDKSNYSRNSETWVRTFVWKLLDY